MSDSDHETRSDQAAPKLIGLSVSFCILDMVRGEVDPDDVEKIIGSTTCLDQAAWDRTIARYRGLEWKEFPDQAEELVRRFIAEGLIEQPRLGDVEQFPIIREGSWVRSEDEITWNTSAGAG